MLRINIPSNGPGRINFSSFENVELPKPPNGIDEEAGNVVLLFDDEEEAVNYADVLEDVSNDIEESNSPVKLAINDIVVGIKGDEFVQNYLG